MDFLTLTNAMGNIKVGNPQNIRPKSTSRGISSISMKSRTEKALLADEKSIAFSDILRAAYSRKVNI